MIVNEQTVNLIEVQKDIEYSIQDVIESEVFKTEDFVFNSNYFNEYNKVDVNVALENLTKKEIKRISAICFGISIVISKMDIKINKNAYNFISFMKDVYLKRKTINSASTPF